MTQALKVDNRNSARSAAAPLGEFGHQKLLSDPGYKVGVAPNVDTLYSVAWVDLALGDLLLETPDFGDRYYALQFGYSDSTCHTIGQRTHGAHPGNISIRWSPSNTASELMSTPSGVELVCHSRFLMIAGRIMVDSSDPRDMREVHDLQERIALTPLGSLAHATPAPPGAAELLLANGGSSGRQFFARLSQVIADEGPESVDPEIREILAGLGWCPREVIGRDATEAEIQASFDRGIESIRRGVAEAGEVRNGWMINYKGVDFGRDWMLRASVAMAQIYINPAEEALYPVLEVDADGRALHGQNTYRLHFGPEQLPPVEYFWSLTMYHAQGLLVENDLARYAIGDRSRHLRYDPDGSLELVISSTKPSDAVDNWLPAPQGGFRLMLRLYGPTQAALDRSWAPPALVLASQ